MEVKWTQNKHNRTSIFDDQTQVSPRQFTGAQSSVWRVAGIVSVMQPNCYNFRTFNNSLRILSPPGANCNVMTRQNTMSLSEERWSDSARNAPMTRATITGERGSIMAELLTD